MINASISIMKRSESIMRLVILGCFLVAVATWIGFRRGYKAGRHDERQAWEATAVSPMAGSTVRLDNDTSINMRTAYSNPHTEMKLASVFRKPQNRPDPRNLPV